VGSYARSIRPYRQWTCSDRRAGSASHSRKRAGTVARPDGSHGWDVFDEIPYPLIISVYRSRALSLSEGVSEVVAVEQLATTRPPLRGKHVKYDSPLRRSLLLLAAVVKTAGSIKERRKGDIYHVEASNLVPNADRAVSLGRAVKRADGPKKADVKY
jgi:hypothetical protein